MRAGDEGLSPHGKQHRTLAAFAFMSAAVPVLWLYIPRVAAQRDLAVAA
jgi:hypothetical protein